MVIDDVNEDIIPSEVRDLNLYFILVSNLLSRIYKKVYYIRESQSFSFDLPLFYKRREEYNIT
jgi:hypothetical protein